MPRFKTTRRVQFRDTDAAGIVHFSVFFTYMEEAEHEMWRALGESVITSVDNCLVGWPRVSASCDYKSPLRFEEQVDILVSVEKIGNKSATLNFDFERGETKIATGKMTAVCVQIENEKIAESITIPDRLREKLAKYNNENT